MGAGKPVSGRRKSTSTSAFGVGRRESHDASGFYDRFTTPVVSADDHVVRSPIGEKPILGDARHMDEVEDASVALVVTSPPYFAGKEYEEALGEGHVPASYFEYLEMLTAVFAEAVRTLEPGGRIAVNVANLGRKPYRSLSADVIGILQDELGLLLRGEVIWLKARGASGSCAWGSFQSPANPVLRDVTERVVIASKGRFDRAVSRQRRAALGLPAEISVSKDEFIEATTDVWEIAAERATRVGHPAPFPVELPLRLIELYTYRDDLVLDPFMGSGTTGVAAVRTGRRFVGYDTETAYVEIAEQRLRAEQDLRMHTAVPAAEVPKPARGAPEEGSGVRTARRRRDPDPGHEPGAQGARGGPVADRGLRIRRCGGRCQDGQRHRGQLLGRRRHGTAVVLRRLGGLHQYAGGPPTDGHAVEGVGQGGGAACHPSGHPPRPPHHGRPGAGQCRRSGPADPHRRTPIRWFRCRLRRHRDGVGRRPYPVAPVRGRGPAAPGGRARSDA